MRIVIVPLLWLGCAVAQLQNLPIGFIDFYGLNGLDAKQLRSALTVHPGDKLNWPGTRDHLIKELTKTAGRPVTHFAPVCCDKNGRVMLYIGFASGSAAVVMRAKSTNHLTLPPQLTELYDQFMLVLPEALKSAPGVPEDYSRGYSLSSHPPMRAIQMRMRETALAHEEELLRVLVEAVDDKQRIVASHLAGYTNHSPRQIAALVEASRDSNGTVRNNATRALAVLAATPKFARGIPAEAFIDHLNSPVWSDRNKGLMLLTSLTRDRNPKVLADLKTRSLPALIEMAHWQNPGHSGGAIRLLGRMAAMDESVLDKLAEAGDPEPVIAAINRPDQKTAVENPHTP